ncbi:MAG: hypothetical protein ABR511_07580 [Acidimicrobiales bacterium]
MAKVLRLDDLTSGGPGHAARTVVGALSGTGVTSEWLDRFLTELDHLAERSHLGRVLDTWGVSKAEAGRLFGVSRQAVDKWLQRGVPAERRVAVADLEVVTDLLLRFVKRERVPAVVRRPADRLGGANMLDLVAQGRTADLVAYTREMFDLRRLPA